MKWRVNQPTASLPTCSGLRDRQTGGRHQQRLTGEDNPPLGNRPHLPGEPQARQRAEGVLLISPGLAQVAEIIRGEREVLEELQSARCAATSGSPACRPPWRSPCFLAVVYLFQRRDLMA
jgi:hypothetical protein